MTNQLLSRRCRERCRALRRDLRGMRRSLVVRVHLRAARHAGLYRLPSRAFGAGPRSSAFRRLTLNVFQVFLHFQRSYRDSARRSRSSHRSFSPTSIDAFKKNRSRQPHMKRRRGGLRECCRGTCRASAPRSSLWTLRERCRITGLVLGCIETKFCK